MSSPDQAAKVVWDGAMYQKVLLVALKVNSLDGAAIWEGWSTLFAMAKQFQRLKKTLAAASLPNDSSMIVPKQKNYRRNRKQKGRSRQKTPSSDSTVDSSEFEL
ncbi:hypothetical protein PRZ48_005289 [Zasmidium cellare]|uniref:Uncharacterized protein n=1 Tax=Zasmidium cellare TaxID=395010 RepID=A0ABR0ETI1_ZASCE|nr:hypothetical protein PRZ48_005289 [Zasmidium cellare]